MKRDGRPRPGEQLTSRLVDRPLRPMMPPGWGFDTQVLQWVLSFEAEQPPEPHAITAAAACLLLSPVPFIKAVAGVQIGRIDGEWVVNPSIEQREASDVDLMMAGTESAVLMIEGFADFVPEADVLAAIAAGQAVISDICRQLQVRAATPTSSPHVIISNHHLCESQCDWLASRPFMARPALPAHPLLRPDAVFVSD